MSTETFMGNADRDKVLVTGGAGFIGSHLVNRLVREGRNVRVLDRPTARIDHLPLHQVEVVRGDIRDRTAVRKALDGIGEVYHLAANPQLWTYPRRQFHEVNFLGTVHVLEEALRAGVRRILHTSTESILTRSRQSEPIREDQVVPPDDIIGPYCRSKHRAENFALSLGKRGHPVIVVNPTLPVGPGDWGCSPPTRMMLDFCLGKRAQYLDAELNLMDVRDIAEGMIQAVRLGKPGRRYLLGHENLSIQMVFRILSELTGVPEPRWKVPYWVALTAACFSELIADNWTREIPAASMTGVMLTRRRMHFDSSQSLRELEIQPRSVRQSMEEAVAWFRQVGWLKEHVRSRKPDSLAKQ